VGFCVFLQKEQKPVPFEEKQKNSDYKNKKQVSFFCVKNRFFSTPIVFQPFCDFPFIARSGTSHVTISLHAYRV